MSWIEDLLQSVGEGYMGQQQGFDWRQNLAAKLIANKRGEQQIKEFEEMAPLRKESLESQIEERRARAEGYLTSEEKLLAQREAATARENLERLRKSLVQARSPEEIALINAKIKELESRAANPTRGRGAAPRLIKVGTQWLRVDPWSNAWSPVGEQSWRSGAIPGVPQTAAERTAKNQMGQALSDAEQMYKIFTSMSPDLHIGWVTGPLSKLGAKTGLGRKDWAKGTPLEVSLLDMWTDTTSTSGFMQRLYAMTGKQINQTEWRRLQQIIPSRSQSLDQARVNAQHFFEEMQRINSRWEHLMQQFDGDEDSAAAVIQNMDARTTDWLLKNPGATEMPPPDFAPAPAGPPGGTERRKTNPQIQSALDEVKKRLGK